MTDQPERWIGDVVAALDRRIAVAGAQPDFLDVVSRAHELDPEQYPAHCLEDAEALGPLFDIEADRDPASVEEERVLDDWLGDVRAAVERKVDDRARGPQPRLRIARDRRGAFWLGGAALAAGILLVLGVTMVVRVMNSSPVETHDQSVLIQEHTGTTGSSITREQPVEPTPSVPRVRPRPVVEHEAVVVQEEPEPEPEPAESKAPRRRGPSKAQRLKTWADEAQEHWRSGRRAEAQRLFEKIVAEGGRSRAVEMAYSDLFTLASQTGSTKAQRARWSAYVRRFPRGRFADDARAGLCRTAPRSERSACWSAYVEDFPRGSFRAEARAAQERP